MTRVEARKLEHLDLCLAAPVESERTTLLDEVGLVHEAVPDAALDDVDCSTTLFGRRLAAPIVVSGMTGGAPRAGAINRDLATAAQALGIGLGLGSQRAMLERPALRDTYAVRDLAPDVPLLANLGLVQAREAGAAAVADLVADVRADALCLHLNVAQELVQDEGDRDFGRALETIAGLVETLAVPVVVKETGCGLARPTLQRLREAGVGMVDVAGAGGTTWPGVESLRGSPRQRALGTLLRDWGVPTAASLLHARQVGLPAIVSGGVRDAVDVVRGLALGAVAAGLALPFLRACEADGARGATDFGRGLVEGVRTVMLLVGARRVDALARVPLMLGPGLRAWSESDLRPRTGPDDASLLLRWIRAQGIHP